MISQAKTLITIFLLDSLADHCGGDEEPARHEEGEVVALRGVVHRTGDGRAQHGGGPAEQHQQPERRCLSGGVWSFHPQVQNIYRAKLKSGP